MALSNGKYFSNVDQGNCYNLTTAAAGTTTPLSSGTAMTFGIWNVTTDKQAVLLQLNGNYTSGTIALGGIGLTDLTTPSFSIATGGPITAFTDAVVGTTVHNCKWGLSGPACRATPSAATITASVAKYWIGSASEGSTETSTLAGRSTISHDFDGKVVILPGHAAFVTGSIAQTALYSWTLIWQEIPY